MAILHSRTDKFYSDNTFLNFYLMNHIPEVYWLSNLLLQFFQELLLFQFSIDRELVSFSLKWLWFLFFYKRMTLSDPPNCCKSSMFFLLSRMTWSRSPTFLLGLWYWALGGWYEPNGLSPNSLFLRSPSPILLNPRPPKYVGLNPRPPKYVGKKFMKRFSIMFHWSSSISGIIVKIGYL